MVALIKHTQEKHDNEQNTSSIYSSKLQLQLQPTKLIGRSKFIIKFMASLHPQFTGMQFKTEVCLTFCNELNIS